MRYLFFQDAAKLLGQFDLLMGVYKTWMANCLLDCDDWAGLVVASQVRSK